MSLVQQISQLYCTFVFKNLKTTPAEKLLYACTIRSMCKKSQIFLGMLWLYINRCNHKCLFVSISAFLSALVPYFKLWHVCLTFHENWQYLEVLSKKKFDVDNKNCLLWIQVTPWIKVKCVKCASYSSYDSRVAYTMFLCIRRKVRLLKLY